MPLSLIILCEFKTPKCFIGVHAWIAFGVLSHLLLPNLSLCSVSFTPNALFRPSFASAAQNHVHSSSIQRFHFRTQPSSSRAVRENETPREWDNTKELLKCFMADNQCFIAFSRRRTHAARSVCVCVFVRKQRGKVKHKFAR